MDEITKRKISAKLKGRKKLATHKKKISQSLRGRKLSEEHKNNIAEAMKKIRYNPYNN